MSSNPDSAWLRARNNACTYIAHIRNAKRKAYATAWLVHYMDSALPEPDASKLPYMAAQGIRLALTEIMEAR